MAFVVNPQTGKVVEAQKKGKNKAGTKQYWLDKKTKKRFTTDMGAEDHVDQKTKKVLKSPKKTAPKKAAKASAPKAKIMTIIKVNSNKVDEVPGELTVDEAFDAASDYFREITKKNVKKSKDSKGNITYAFTVKTGSKG